MTKILPAKIKCKCGNEVEMQLYDSVNVTLNPELKEKIIKREINIFECPKCGVKSPDLAYPFLYADMTKKIWIWCYPEEMEKDRERIEKELNGKMPNLISRIDFKTMFAFGYDELEKILDIEK